MSGNVTVTDSRASRVAENELLERWPLGGFVAFNGPSGDGERRRAVVVGHDVAAGAVTLRDGANLVMLGATELAEAVLVARSADEYAWRVRSRGRALGREYGRERVATQALAQLDQPPEADPTPLRVRVITTVEYELQPHDTGVVDHVDVALREALTVYTPQFNERYFVGGSRGETREVVITVLDPPTDAASTDTSEEEEDDR